MLWSSMADDDLYDLSDSDSDVYDLSDNDEAAPSSAAGGSGAAVLHTQAWAADEPAPAQPAPETPAAVKGAPPTAEGEESADRVFRRVSTGMLERRQSVLQSLDASVASSIFNMADMALDMTDMAALVIQRTGRGQCSVVVAFWCVPLLRMRIR